MSNSATTTGTTRYKNRFPEAAKGHYRNAQNLWLSTIGIGTYLGDCNEKTDKNYIEAITKCVELGGNVIDTAANYRFQRSEKNIGEALLKLKEKGFEREELFICTKAGFLSFEAGYSTNVRNYFEETFVKKGIAGFEDLVNGSHCIKETYIQHQLEQSLTNMGIDCIDLFYIHNPETQLSEIERPIFEARLAKAFEQLEKNREEGKIRFYGVSTWEAFRTITKEKKYLSLERLVNIAKQIGGENHGFKFIQQPFSIAMPEAMIMPNQAFGTKVFPMLETAKALNVNVMASSPLLHGKLVNFHTEDFRKRMGGVENNAQVSLQFVRSAPNLTSLLAGMSQVKHVEENLRLKNYEPLSEQDYRQMFTGE